MEIPLPIIIYFTALFVLGLLAIYLQNKLIGRKSLEQTLNEHNEAIIFTTKDFGIICMNSKAMSLLAIKSDHVNQKIYKLFKEFDKSKLEGTFSALHEIDKNKVQKIYLQQKPLALDFKKNSGFLFFLEDADDYEHYKNIQSEKQEYITNNKIKITALQKEIDARKKELEVQIQNQKNSFEADYTVLSASINNLSLGFIMIDDKKRFVMCNNLAVNIFPNLALRNSQDKNLLKHLPEQLNIQIDKAIKNKKNIALIGTMINSKYLDITISPIFYDEKSENCLGAVIIIEDKQEQRALEQSKLDLFSIASHELRTPLTAIYGYISLIKQIYFSDIKDSEVKQIINNIGVLSKKLSMNINTFLDSSKLEQGKIELKHETCNLFEIVNEAIKETERFTAEKDLYLKLDYPTESISVAGDKLRLIQIMTILLSNAIKFTQSGGIYVRVVTIDDFAHVSVRDTGMGIPEENKLLLFSKFQQTVENLLTRQEGTGLGLHLAKLLVEKMGGAIWLEKSELNKGSEFIFTIPLQNN